MRWFSPPHNLNKGVLNMKKSKKLLSINHTLAKNKVLAVTVIIGSFLLFFIFNYVIVCIMKILIGLKNHNLDFDSVASINSMFCFDYVRQLKIVYIAFFILLCYASARYVYLMKISFKSNNVGQKGKARWTTLEEIKNTFKEIPEKTEFFEGRGGIPVCRYKKKIYIDDTAVNNVILGVTRSGKGEMFVFPMIDIYSRASEKASLIITDPKLELFSSSKDILEKRGYIPLVLNLINPLNSMGFNPLTLIIEAYKNKDYQQAEKLCLSFCYSIYTPDKSSGDSKFWDDSSVSCLSALILAHVHDCLEADERENAKNLLNFNRKKQAYEAQNKREKEDIACAFQIRDYKEKNVTDMKVIASELGITIQKVKKLWLLADTVYDVYVLPDMKFELTNKFEKQITLYSIINTFSLLASQRINDYTTALDIYFNDRPDSDRAKLKYAGVSIAGNKTKSSIFTTTLSKLSVFTYEEIAKMTAESTLNLVDIGFGDKPYAIFIGIPEYDKSYHFLSTVFINQLYYILSKTATNGGTDEDAGECKREVIFILDEFGNMPPLDNMRNVITMCLSRRIKFNLIIQSYQQVRDIYKDCGETVLDNCLNHIYIRSNDPKTIKQFSEDLGNETITTLNRSGKMFQGDKNVTEMYEARPLMDTTDLKNLKKKECIILRAKREDLKNNNIDPTPIYNTGKTAFKFRHEYMIDDFPKKSISNIEIKGNTDIDLANIRFDIRKYFEDKQKKDEGNIDAEYIEVELKIKETARAKTLIPLLQKLHLNEDIREMTVAHCIAVLNKLETDQKITTEEKESLIKLLTT